MNAAFLLVTSALLVGQAGDKKMTPPPAAAPAPAVASSCGPTCGSDCGCDTSHKLRDRLRGMFSRCDTCDTCKPTCHEPKPVCCAPVKTSCDPCERTSFLTKLRERFRRHDTCCESSCTTCGATPATAPAKGEAIPAPSKKMPEAPKGKAVDIRIENTPAPNAISVTPSAAPIVEVTPIPVPRVDGARRDPF